jgi:hypothetical protein
MITQNDEVCCKRCGKAVPSYEIVN